MHQVLGNYETFLNQIFNSLSEINIDTSKYYLDHICYRVSTNDNYLEKKAELSKIAQLLLENEVGGRLISKFKLFSPIKYAERLISVIELPSPKEGVPYKDGLEHVEFVIDIPLKDFIQKYPHVSFNMEGYNKSFNSDVAIKIGEYTAKFHEQSLEDVVKIEKQNI